jgi:hypothetical protein
MEVEEPATGSRIVLAHDKSEDTLLSVIRTLKCQEAEYVRKTHGWARLTRFATQDWQCGDDNNAHPNSSINSHGQGPEIFGETTKHDGCRY